VIHLDPHLVCFLGHLSVLEWANHLEGAKGHNLVIHLELTLIQLVP